MQIIDPVVDYWQLGNSAGVDRNLDKAKAYLPDFCNC